VLLGTATSLIAQPAPAVGRDPTTIQQSTDTKGYAIVEKGASHNIWQRTTWETRPTGQAVPHIHKFTQIATGLHFKRNGQDGDWLDTSEQIQPLPGGTGAAATNGPHSVFFPADLSQGKITTLTPDGKHLSSRPIAITYFDGSNYVTISTITNSFGQIILSPGNQVIYTNCFPGLADVIATYRKSGTECDLVFRARPPAPDEFNLVPENCRLQLWTEWFDTPDPVIKPAPLDKTDGLPDAKLDFGAFKMVRGRSNLLRERLVLC
jgi:hypothetical protein